jgi:DNA primase catalytic core
MEIAEIKSRLSITTVLQHYGLQSDRNRRLCCPFHPDTTPSLQIYPDTNTAYCFSSNCPTHGKSMDVIDFIMNKENTSKHEAIIKAKALLGDVPEPIKNNMPMKEKTPVDSDFLEKMFTLFKTGLQKNDISSNYLMSRCLTPSSAGGEGEGLEIGYNSGQFYSGEHKNENLINQCLEAGLLIDKGLKSKAYNIFGNKCIVFPLRNKENRIVSLYFRSITNIANQKHYYLKNRQGLYPGYPPKNTKILILTESIIDAASFTLPEPDVFVLACYGTNGLTEEHIEAIKSLPELEEVVFAFDTDEAGKAATEKLSLQLQAQYPNLKLTAIELPCKDVNETLIAHSPEIFPHLLNERKPINTEAFLFSTDSIERKKEEEPTKEEKPNILNTQNPDCLTYETDTLLFSEKILL